MCFEWLSEQTVTFALYVIDRLLFITEVESVYCAVRTDSLHNTDNLVFNWLIMLPPFVPLITSSGIPPCDFFIITLCVFLYVYIRATWYAHFIIDLDTLTSD
jgi:hypothetical protein